LIVEFVSFDLVRLLVELFSLSLYENVSGLQLLCGLNKMFAFVFEAKRVVVDLFSLSCFLWLSSCYTRDVKRTSRDLMVIHEMLNERVEMQWLYMRC
jgi:hypothetical protein